MVLLLPGCTTFSIYDLFPSSAPTGLSETAREVAQPIPVELPRELNKSVHPPYLLEPGDGLLIQPEDLDSPVRLPNDQVVLQDGTIDLGEYGRLLVAGKSLPQVEREVQEVIAQREEEAGWISVRLVNRESKVFYVLGEVNTPGSFPLAGRETALDAILIAGGLTPQASRDGIILVRPTAPPAPRLVLKVCYPAIVQLGDTSTNYQIAAGDRIYVPRGGLCEDLFGTPCEADPASNGGCGHVAARQGNRPPVTLELPVKMVGH